MPFHFSNRKALIILILLFTVVSMTVFGCQSPKTVTSEIIESHPTSVNDAGQAGVMGKPIVDYITAHSIDDLVIRADLIVIGQVEKIDRVINAARDVNDIAKPDLSFLILGQIYQIKVDTWLKGEAPGSSVFFAQLEGILEKQQESEEPSTEDIELAHQNLAHYPFIANHRYLLFLTSVEGFDYFFSLGLHPWRFDVTNENNVYSESPAIVNIRPAPLTTILEQIQAALTPTPESTVISPLPTPIAIETATVEAPALP